MSIFQIADKTTLDKIDTDVTAIKARGGFKKEGDILYGYDVANSAWEEINFAGLTGANPTLIVLNHEMSMTGKPVTVSIAGGWYQKTQIMPNAKYDVFVLPKLGSYNVTWTYSKNQKTKVVNVDRLGGVTTSVVYYPSFAEATWDQIDTLVTRSYNDSEFNLEDIWSVGDKKSVDFAASTGQAAGKRDIVILDFDYDTLITSVSGHTKAKITLGTRLPSARTAADSYMNAGWDATTLRSYLNNGFYNSMPSGLRSLIKPISKSGVSDKCSVLSIAEYNGTGKYEYLKDSSNISMFNNSWLRDNYYQNYRYFYYTTTNYGTTSGIPWMATANVAPIFSI